VPYIERTFWYTYDPLVGLGHLSSEIRTQELSDIDKILGAKREAGVADLPVGEGEPRPDMPGTLWTLYLLLADVLTDGRIGGTGGTLLLSLCRLPADIELVRAGVGGELPPYTELNVDEDLLAAMPEPLEPLPPVLESVLLSVLKLDLDLRRISLRKEGAIALQAHVYRTKERW
jgi:hypothetical protein